MSLVEDPEEPIPHADDLEGDPVLRDLFSSARRDLPAVDVPRIVVAATAPGFPWLRLGLGGASIASLVLFGISVGSRPAPVAAPRRAEPPANVAPSPQPVRSGTAEVLAPTRGGGPSGASVTDPARDFGRPSRRRAQRMSRQPAADDLEEGALLLRARRALAASDPRAALEAVAEHEVRFGAGRLAPEREAIAIDALVGTGRDAAAAARATRFLERWPDSPYAARARRASR